MTTTVVSVYPSAFLLQLSHDINLNDRCLNNTTKQWMDADKWIQHELQWYSNNSSSPLSSSSTVESKNNDNDDDNNTNGSIATTNTIEAINNAGDETNWMNGVEYFMEQTTKKSEECHNPEKKEEETSLCTLDDVGRTMESCRNVCTMIRLLHIILSHYNLDTNGNNRNDSHHSKSPLMVKHLLSCLEQQQLDMTTHSLEVEVAVTLLLRVIHPLVMQKRAAMLLPLFWKSTTQMVRQSHVCQEEAVETLIEFIRQGQEQLLPCLIHPDATVTIPVNSIKLFLFLLKQLTSLVFLPRTTMMTSTTKNANHNTCLLRRHPTLPTCLLTWIGILPSRVLQCSKMNDHLLLHHHRLYSQLSQKAMTFIIQLLFPMNKSSLDHSLLNILFHHDAKNIKIETESIMCRLYHFGKLSMSQNLLEHILHNTLPHTNTIDKKDDEEKQQYESTVDAIIRISEFILFTSLPCCQPWLPHTFHSTNIPMDESNKNHLLCNEHLCRSLFLIIDCFIVLSQKDNDLVVMLQRILVRWFCPLQSSTLHPLSRQMVIATATLYVFREPFSNTTATFLHLLTSLLLDGRTKTNHRSNIATTLYSILTQINNMDEVTSQKMLLIIIEEFYRPRNVPSTRNTKKKRKHSSLHRKNSKLYFWEIAKRWPISDIQSISFVIQWIASTDLFWSYSSSLSNSNGLKQLLQELFSLFPSSTKTKNSSNYDTVHSITVKIHGSIPLLFIILSGAIDRHCHNTNNMINNPTGDKDAYILFSQRTGLSHDQIFTRTLQLLTSTAKDVSTANTIPNHNDAHPMDNETLAFVLGSFHFIKQSFTHNRIIEPVNSNNNAPQMSLSHLGNEENLNQLTTYIQYISEIKTWEHRDNPSFIQHCNPSHMLHFDAVHLLSTLSYVLYPSTPNPILKSISLAFSAFLKEGQSWALISYTMTMIEVFASKLISCHRYMLRDCIPSYILPLFQCRLQSNIIYDFQKRRQIPYEVTIQSNLKLQYKENLDLMNHHTILSNHKMTRGKSYASLTNATIKPGSRVFQIFKRTEQDGYDKMKKSSCNNNDLVSSSIKKHDVASAFIIFPPNSNFTSVKQLFNELFKDAEKSWEVTGKHFLMDYAVDEINNSGEIGCKLQLRHAID